MFERELSLQISHFFVALDNNALVGYGGYWQVLDEAHIVTLAVHPDCRHQGTGRHLLKHLLSHIAAAGSIAKILLEVRAGNDAARRLYESEGFRVSGLRPKYYEMKEDAVLMERVV